MNGNLTPLLASPVVSIDAADDALETSDSSTQQVDELWEDHQGRRQLLDQAEQELDRLREQRRALQKQVKVARKAIATLRKNLGESLDNWLVLEDCESWKRRCQDNFEARKEKYERHLAGLTDSLNRCRNSRSFRVGLALTWPVRLVRRWLFF